MEVVGCWMIHCEVNWMICEMRMVEEVGRCDVEAPTPLPKVEDTPIKGSDLSKGNSVTRLE